MGTTGRLEGFLIGWDHDDCVQRLRNGVIEQVTPVAVAEEGRNFLRVEADIEGDVKRLRPGMSGACHVHVGERRLIWIWTRGFMDWLLVFAWRWLG